MITDIPTVVIRTELYEQNQCQIEINTTRLHNEILKHRLSCIPVNVDFKEEAELEGFANDYVLELDVKNEGEHTIYVTTDDFRIRSKTTGKFVTKEETRKIFPPHDKTNYYIDFVRLRPKLSDTIPGEHIKLTAEFSVSTAKENSMFSVISKCTYGNTIDIAEKEIEWKKRETKLREKAETDITKEEIAFHRKNFEILDAQRYFVADSYDFAVRSVGVFDNIDIVYKACLVLQQRFQDRITELDSGLIMIKPSETVMEHSYDIILEEEDYTVGKVLEYLLHEKYFKQDKIMSFCGFKKYHPHDTNSTIRLAYHTQTNIDNVRQHIRAVAILGIEIFGNIGKFFHRV
jgi:DNA-directed RNA polymerase subunit L